MPAYLRACAPWLSPDEARKLQREDAQAWTVSDLPLLAGPFAHVAVDEAQDDRRRVADAAPSWSFTIVGDRAQARHGFTESWQERLQRIGLDRITLASLTINYRSPEEVMAEAEPVIRAVLPDVNVPASIRSSDVPVVHGSASDLGSILDTSRVRSTPELSKGSSSTWSSSSPRGVRRRHRRSGRPLCRDDSSDPTTRHPHELLTGGCRSRASDVGATDPT